MHHLYWSSCCRACQTYMYSVKTVSHGTNPLPLFNPLWSHPNFLCPWFLPNLISLVPFKPPSTGPSQLPSQSLFPSSLKHYITLKPEHLGWWVWNPVSILYFHDVSNNKPTFPQHHSFLVGEEEGDQWCSSFLDVDPYIPLESYWGSFSWSLHS